MTNLVQFNFEASSIQTIVKDGEIFFRASDLTNALNFGNSRQAIATHVDEEDVQLLDTLTRGGNQKVKFVNESGMYALIFGSVKPEAKRFKKWVTAEVLPQIRKTGHYRQTTPSDRTPLRQAVSFLVGKRGIGYDVAYSLVHQYMGVSHIDQIPQAELPRAIAYVHQLALSRSESLTQAVQNLAWHTLVIHSWYKAIEPHFRALSPQLAGEICEHIQMAKIFAGTVQDNLGLGQMTPMLPHLQSKRWAISY